MIEISLDSGDAPAFRGYIRSSPEANLLADPDICAIVRRFAEAHGWTVTLTESAAGGARFEFSGVEIE